jgi:putative transposase
MIAAGIVHLDLHAAPLAEPSQVVVLIAPEAAVGKAKNGMRKPGSFAVADLRCGITVAWDGRIWNIVNVGKTSASLLSDDRQLMEFPRTAVEALIQQKRIEIVPTDVGHGSDPAICERLSRAREVDLGVANQRSRLIHYYLESGRLPAETDVPARTFYRWLAQYRAAETGYGSGYLGLLPESGKRENHTPRLCEASRRLMEESLVQDYETLKQKTRYASWVGLRLSCEAKAIPVPSYQTFCVAVNKRSSFSQTLKRQGRRASYELKTFYWELELKTPGTAIDLLRLPLSTIQNWIFNWCVPALFRSLAVHG